MRTIVEPKEYIYRLWGKQRIRNEDTYRMMRYVLRVDHDGNVLLHNVVTGQLVVLNQDETGMVNRLPLKYQPVMEQLVAEHFLVPEGFDEHKQVINLRTILRNLDEAKKPEGVITHYTILPTTACNARCYYCFEQGCETLTMTAQMADNVVRYIDDHCGEQRRIQLSWFGGEPTVADRRIDQICEGLLAKGIYYQSDITTNGYLLNEEMVEKAIKLWKLKSCMICLDGIGNTYNKIKAYVTPVGDPYEQVMRNIAVLLEHSVRVNLRMNFDLSNYTEFADLVVEAKKRYGTNPFLSVHAHPIFGEHRDHDGKVLHASNEWFTQKVVELNDMAREAGLLWDSNELPSIEFKACQASGKSSVGITPDGLLIRCPEQFEKSEATGSVLDAVMETVVAESWKHYADLEMCEMCTLLPICQRNERCMARDTCCYRSENLKKFKKAMVRVYNNSIGGNAK